jgi:hypothetical protein
MYILRTDHLDWCSREPPRISHSMCPISALAGPAMTTWMAWKEASSYPKLPRNDLRPSYMSLRYGLTATFALDLCSSSPVRCMQKSVFGGVNVQICPASEAGYYHIITLSPVLTPGSVYSHSSHRTRLVSIGTVTLSLRPPLSEIDKVRIRLFISVGNTASPQALALAQKHPILA